MLNPHISQRVKKLTNGNRGTLEKAPLLEIAGHTRVLIENHLGVLAYSCEEIQVKVKFGKFIVTGQKMELLQMDRDQLVICGQIDSVQVLRR